MQLLLDFHIPFTFSRDAVNWKYNLVHSEQQFVLQRTRRTSSWVQPGGEVCTVDVIWQLFLWKKCIQIRTQKNEGKLPLKVDPEALIVSFVQWHWVRALSVRSYFSLAQESCQDPGRLWKGILCPVLPSMRLSSTRRLQIETGAVPWCESCLLSWSFHWNHCTSPSAARLSLSHTPRKAIHAASLHFMPWRPKKYY